MHIEYGQADTYWDATPSREQMAELELRTTDIRSISVFVNVETGELELNPAHEENSPEGRDEEDIWNTYKGEIHDLLLARATKNQLMAADPAYDAFRASAAPRPRM